MQPFSDRWQPSGVDPCFPPLDDEDLATRWREGDAGAGTLLVQRYRAPITRYFRKRAPEYAEELTQRTFEALTRSHRTYRHDSTLRRYLFGIARKILFKHYAEVTKWARFEADGTADRESPVPAGHALLQADLEGKVEGALALLPTDVRVAMRLHYWDGLSMDELAAAHRTKPGTIKSRLHRGRALMRDHLLARARPDDYLPAMTGLAEV